VIVRHIVYARLNDITLTVVVVAVGRLEEFGEGERMSLRSVSEQY